MPARRRTTFPGLPQDAVTELVGMQDGLQKDTADLRAATVGSTTDTKTSGYNARFNEAIRVQFPAAGGTLTFPAAATASVDRWIEVLLLGGGACKVQPTSGLVQGAASESLTTAGRYMYRSDGLNSWWRAGSSGGGGGGSWSASLAIGATSGANNPIVDVGQFMQFGLVGPTTSSPQIRSGDANLRIRGSAIVSVGGVSGASLFTTGAGAPVEVGSDAGTVNITTNAGTVRLAIANTGEWTTPAGSSGQVLTHQGAGVPPVWAAAAGGGTDPRIFAWFGV